ncbi:MAG: protein kinase [Deltaproteobacteria bacterium]
MDPQQGPPQSDLLIGQTVGNYLVKQRLGEGGMGAVYLAEHPTIGKKVALKVLHAEFATNTEVVERFFNEAKAVNSIAHPNIVDIVDYGVIQTGPRGSDQLVYFIMEYLSGQTLAQVIRAEAPLPPERALTIALQVADALAASHRAGIVHRDLKPDNIILGQRGREQDFVKLLDFGIAKLTTDGRTGNRTRTGIVLGTPAYMSPEQCEGSAKVDHRTDIYALGICLYEMLVGRVPFIGEGYGEILVQHLTQKPIEPSRFRMMSPHVEQVVLKALEKRSEMRYPTMDEMIRAMADPVGYVESHGGVQGFLQRTLTPSTAPLPPARLTPSPLTPIPGMYTPPPGSITTSGVVTPSPTTLSAATGQVSASRGKTGFVIAGALVVGAAIAGVAVVLSGGGKKTEGAGSGSAVTQQVGSSGSATVMTVEHGSAGSAVATGSATPNTGSATASGSATTTTTGSAAIATGSATTTNTGSGTGSAAVLPAVATLTLSSTPDGAEIFINYAPTGKKTPATLQLPKTGKVTIGFRLKGYDDLFLKDIALDSDAITKEATLKKTHTGGGTGHGSAHGTGKGSAKQCDTCLERPD